MTLAIGTEAPDFVLPGTDGTGGPEGRRDYRLSEFRGLVVVLVFYPADSSPVCTVQLNTYTADIARFDDVGAQVLAISPQSVEDHVAFAAHNDGFKSSTEASKESESWYFFCGFLASRNSASVIIAGS